MNWEWIDYDDFVTKYGIPYWKYDEKKGEKRAVQFVDVFAYYEGLGVLVQTNNVDVELIGRFGGVPDIWDKFEPIIYEVRSRIGNPYAWSEFEELVLRIHESFDNTSIISEELNARKRRRKALGLREYPNQ